jgi:dCMP deaminase
MRMWRNGSRARLRIWCRKAWGFESLHAHSKSRRNSPAFLFVIFFGKNFNLCGMKKPGFDDIYMDLAVNLSQKSHCVKAQVGAVLTKDTRIISVGYNGPPAGTHNCDEEWPGHGCPRDSKGSCSLALHAEQNAILYATKNNVSMEGSTLYITLAPCIACARVIYTVGIKKVFYMNSYAEMKGLPSEEGVDFLKKFGVDVVRHKNTLKNA